MLVSVFLHINEIDNNQARKILSATGVPVLHASRLVLVRSLQYFVHASIFLNLRQWRQVLRSADHKIHQILADLRTVDRVHLIFRIKMLENWLSVIILFNLF